MISRIYRACSFAAMTVFCVAATSEAHVDAGAPPGSDSASPETAAETSDRVYPECTELQSITLAQIPFRRSPLVSVHVRPDGSMHDPVLVESSGDGDMDRSVLACAGKSHAGEMAVSGSAAETIWVLGYYRQSRWAGFSPASPDGTPAESCDTRRFSRASNDKTIASGVVISYAIAATGLTKNVSIVAGSGAPDLDRQAASCISAWRFFPVYRNGNAAEIERTFTLRWQFK